jgi:Cu/Ag efflux protein CusF
MPRRFSWIAASVLVLFAAWLPAQEEIQRGKIKKVDVESNTVVITIADNDAKDITVQVTPETRLVGADNKDLGERLKSIELKAGAAVAFRIKTEDGKHTLLGMRLAPAGKGNSPGDIQRGKIKKLDLDQMTITVTQADKERTLHLTDATQVLDAKGDTLKQRLAGFKDGAEVYFKPGRRDGKDVLEGIKLASAGPGGREFQKVDSSGLKPLTELGSGEYQGFVGGLYPGGKNERPAAHEAAGTALAKQVRPLDLDGKPAPDGKIVLLSVGMSNTGQASNGLQKAIAAASDVNPLVRFVSGAVGGMTAFAIQDPETGSGIKYWATVDQRLKEAGVSRAQVQAIWIKEADAGPSEGFPGYAQKLRGELTRVVQLLPSRFPNLRLVYLSSRTYGGYAKTPLNPEPYAYESGFAVRWLIEDQIKGSAGMNFDAKKGDVRAPWLSWGPYLWANGAKKRADGFHYDEKDFTANDGTHLSESGVRKVGQALLEFFRTDTTTRPWFTKASAPRERGE